MDLVKRALLCLVLSSFLHAQPKWRHMETENFQIYSQAGDRETRAALQYFERVRSFFIKLRGAALDNAVPVYIVMFNSEKEYAPYRISESAIAYYAGQAERDYIVLGKTGEQTAQAATHEYVHLLVRHLGIKWPAWLNEGQADLFSTLKVVGNNTEFGDLLPGRMIGLFRDKWVPLNTIFGVDHESPYYNEKDKASNFYNESWVLTHMLATSNEYRPGWDRFQDFIAQGVPSAEALERTYGKPIERIEAELKAYVKGNNFRKLMIPTGVESVKLKDPSQAANDFDVRLALADLLRGENEAERKSRLEALAREYPTRPEAHASLGYLAWGDRNFEQTAAHFAKAFELGTRSSKFLWDFGRIAQATQPEGALAALNELVKLEPQNAEARMEVALVHLRAQRWSQALIAARGFKNITPDLAPRLFSVMAQSEMQLGMREDARKSADNLLKYAKTDAERTTAQRILDYLDRVGAQEQARLNAAAARSQPQPQAQAPAIREPELAEATRTSTAPPALIRRDPTEEEVRRSILYDANGRFVELVCTGDSASMVLETAQGRKRYRILEPNRIIVTGSAEGFASMSCGVQKNPVALRVQFSEPTPDIKADGIVRAVHFPAR